MMLRLGPLKLVINTALFLQLLIIKIQIGETVLVTTLLNITNKANQ